MDTYVLQRATAGSHGTFGILVDPKNFPLCLTCEDPWNGNFNNISCVPPGLYKVSPHTGKKYQNVWKLEGDSIKHRPGILIHNGNDIDDTEGCILVGSALSKPYEGQAAVLYSRTTLEMLKKILPKTFYLDIRNPNE